MEDSCDWSGDSLKKLVLAVIIGDGKAVVATMDGRVLPEMLQVAGDGLLTALHQGVSGSATLAGRLRAALMARGYRGDQELAQQLDAALGTGPTPMLRSVPVELDELCLMLEAEPTTGGGYMDTRTGALRPDYSEMFGLEKPDISRSNAWIKVECQGFHDSFNDMRLFIRNLEDPHLAGELSSCLGMSSPFRRFKAAAQTFPGLWEQWCRFHDERQRGRARAWLARQGFRPAIRGASR